MAPIKESVVVKWINQAIEIHGDGVVKYRPVPSMYGARYLDYIICAYGFHAVIEAKRPRKEPTDNQWEKLDAVTMAGGATFYLNNKPDVDRFLLWLRRCKDLRMSLERYGMMEGWPNARTQA